MRDVELIAASAASSTIFGGRSTRTELSSTSWSKPPRRHRDQAILPQAAERLVIAPRVIVTDKLKSYAAAKREILPSVEHRQSRYSNNRAEVSHQLTRR